MINYDRLGLALSIAKSLKDEGSWCGETHLQKTSYLLGELLAVNPGWTFVLYKHGPYSFDLHDDIVTAQATGLLTQRPQPPYGPSLELTDDGSRLLEKLGTRFAAHQPKIDFVARKVGSKNVFELEQVATAVYVSRQAPSAIAEERANKLLQLKPHVTQAAAQTAVRDAELLSKEAASATTGTTTVATQSA